MSHINASPSFQRLSLDGKELEDDEKTMSDYLIVPDDILTLEILKQQQLSWEAKEEKADLEAGFVGTFLLPAVARECDFAMSNELEFDASLLPHEIFWDCTQCTFSNTGNRKTCDICGSDRITASFEKSCSSFGESSS